MFKKTKEKDYVFCEECGVAIRKEMAQKVEDFYYGYIQKSCHYCDRHKKPYNEMRIVYNVLLNKELKEYYILNVQVNEKGKIIK